MAALLPTILSDDEDGSRSPINDDNDGGKKKRKKANRNERLEEKIEDFGDDIDGEGSSNDEMDGDFEFGGLLVSSDCP